MPDVTELGRKVKAKYPGQYDDLADDDVGRRVKAKYPGAYDDFADTPKRPSAEEELIGYDRFRQEKRRRDEAKAEADLLGYDQFRRQQAERRAKQHAEFERKPYLERKFERALDEFRAGGLDVSRMARQALGAGMGAVQAFQGGKPEVVDFPAWREREEERRRNLAERERARPPMSLGEEIGAGIVRGVPTAGGAIALGTLTGGGALPTMATGGGMSAAGADWSNPRRAAAETALGAVAPVVGGKIGQRVGGAVASRLGRPAAQTAARAGGEIVGGGAANVLQSAALGERRPRELVKAGVVGSALSAPGAMAAARRPMVAAKAPAAAEMPIAAPESIAAAMQAPPAMQGVGLQQAFSNLNLGEGFRKALRDSVATRGRLPSAEQNSSIGRAFEAAVANGAPRNVATLDQVLQSLEQAATQPPQPTLPSGVRVIRVSQGEQIPPRERGQRQIPLDIEQPDGSVETVLVISPDRINGRRVDETTLRPLAEQALRPQPPAQPVSVTTTGAEPAPPRVQPEATRRTAEMSRIQPEVMRQTAEIPRVPTAPTYPDAPETQEMPAIRARITAENAPTAELPMINPPKSAPITSQGQQAQRGLGDDQIAQPPRPRTERLPVPKATEENIQQLRKRQEELGRLAYDRRGDFTGDLRDEYNQLTAHIRDYDNQRAPQELAPPPGTQPGRMVPPAGELQARRRALDPKTRFASREDERQGHFERFNDEELIDEIRRMEEQRNLAIRGKSKLTPAEAEANEFDLKIAVEMQKERGRIQREQGREPGERIAPRAAQAGVRTIQHSQFGELTVASDQSGVRRGFLRVSDTAGAPHIIKNPRTKGGGNREAAFVRSTGAIPAEAMPELRAPNAPPSPLAGRPAKAGQGISYAIPDEAMPELRDRPKPKLVRDAERRLKNATTGHISGSGTRQMADVAIVAGWKVYKAGMDFARWSAEVVKQAGEQVRPHLRAAWDQINKSFSVGALPNEGKGGTHLGSGFGALQPLFERGGKPKASAPEPQPGDLTRRERLGRKIGTLQTAAQLLNPKTISQNIIGNAAFSGVKNAATFAAIPVDRFLSLVTRQRQVVTPELRTQFRDFVDGFTDIYHAVKAKDYASLADNRYELSNERVFKGKVGGFVEDALNIALRAPDRGAYLAAYNDSVQQILAAHAKSKTKFSLDSIHEQAKLEAQQAVFQDKNMISNFTVKLRRALNVVTPFGKKANFGLGDMVGLKYARTPANLLARGIEYSPANFVNAFYKIGKVMAGKGKGFDQRDASLAFGKAFVGSTFGSGMGALLYAMGVITQPELEDRGVQAAERGEGLFGYQLNLSALKRYATGGLLAGNFDAGKKQAGDVLQSYDWLQPWAFSIGMGAAAMKAAGKQADADAIEETLTQIDAVTSTLTDQSILRNVRDVGKFGFKSTARKVATDAPASFVPSVLNQARQIIDDRAREISKEKGISGVKREAFEKVVNRLPGVSKRLPEKQDVVGRPVPSRMAGTAGAALVPVPGRFARYAPHPVLTEMQATGSGAAGIKRKDDETKEQFRARRAKVAGWRDQYGRTLTASPAYKSATPELRKAALEYLKRTIADQSGEKRPSLDLLRPSHVLATVRQSAREAERKERREAR